MTYMGARHSLALPAQPHLCNARMGQDSISIHPGDNAEVLVRLAAAGSLVDSVVTDPPYHLLTSSSRGFMGKEWDGGGIAFQPETWGRVAAVMKPGGHLLAFGGSRTFARMQVAIENGGLEIRDTIAWLYGSGFPKSLDVAKGIDRQAGHWRGRAGLVKAETVGQVAKGTEYQRTPKGQPITSAARQWEGWGTALKPAMELICVARKPLSENTVANNVLRHGTGALNIDKCRIETDELQSRDVRATNQPGNAWAGAGLRQDWAYDGSKGRWPPNVIHDGSEEVAAGFPGEEHRFFYTAKAATAERECSKHPTVKPLDLMRYLVRLVTPLKGTVLDPFAGSGTTGVAAVCEGMKAILIEREPDYLLDIQRRVTAAQGRPQGTETEPGLFNETHQTPQDQKRDQRPGL